MRIEQISDCNIIFMRRTGAYGIENAKLMDSFKTWIEDNRLYKEDSVILGIARDNPIFVSPEECRYDVCLVVSGTLETKQESIRMGSIEGGRYAVFLMDHTKESVQSGWNCMFEKLEYGGYRLDESRSILERYDSKMIQNHCCEMCIPIQS